MTTTVTQDKSRNLALVSLIIIPIIFLCGLFVPKGWNWLLIVFFMSLFLALIGKYMTGRWSGIFINERNRMTLSRFQLVIWTVIVLSAFLTIALERVYANTPDPLAIALPTQLWALLGISTASLVGSPLVLSTKVQKTPAQAAVYKAAMWNKQVAMAQNIIDKEEKKPTDKRDQTTIHNNKAIIKTEEERIKKDAETSGTLASNENINQAKFSEMFNGDEKGNEHSIDMAKVQMFFFTLIIAFSYMVLLVNLIMTTVPAGLNSFPALSDSVVALLGISASGYLTSKTIDHTKTE